jgi:hypothetical protein
MTTPMTPGGRTVPGEVDNFGVIFQEHPPFTPGDFNQLSEWALRVERSLVHLGSSQATLEVAQGLSDDRMIIFASTSDLEKAEADIAKYAESLNEKLRTEFGMVGYTSAIIKSELDATIAGASQKFDIIEVGLQSTIAGAQAKFDELESNMKKLYEATQASEQHLRSKLGQEFGKIASTTAASSSPPLHPPDAWAGGTLGSIGGPP